MLGKSIPVITGKIINARNALIADIIINNPPKISTTPSSSIYHTISLDAANALDIFSVNILALACSEKICQTLH